MIKGWKLFETSNNGYKWVNKRYPSLFVTLNPWNKSGRDSIYITIRAEDTVLADASVEDKELLRDNSTFQEFLDDVEDITSVFMRSFERILSRYSKYSIEQTILLLLLVKDKDIDIIKREFDNIPDKFNNLFY